MQAGLEAPALSDGRYVLTRRIGEGGMASVFLAWDTKLKVWRAVKLLLPSTVAKKKVRKRFENEAHAMARLEHPHIVRIYDVGAEHGIPYMIQELAEGGSIVDWLGRYGAMPPRLAVDVTVQICKGIQAAHEAGIVHRDIKPHNILVNRKGQCKVTDFGIAQVMDHDTLTKTGSVMGTWGFMAPEQRTDAKAVDHRADVFSIGATLYTLLTNRTPTELYVAEEDDEVFAGIPHDLLQVIMRACRYKPDARYPDVKSLAVAVHKAGSTQPPVPPSTPSLILSSDPLPESVESAQLSPTIVQDLNSALGRKPDTTAPDEDTKPEAGDTPPEEPPPSSTAEPTSRVLPYYMPSKRGNDGPVRRSRYSGLSSTGVPSYLDPTEIERETHAQRAVRFTPPPAVKAYEPPPPASMESEGPGPVEFLLKFALPPILIGMILLSILGYGTVRVNSAAEDAQAQADVLFARLQAPGPLVDGLAVAGANRNHLEREYMKYADAKGYARGPAAVGFVDALEQSSVALETPPSVKKELSGLKKARDAYNRSRAKWTAESDTALGTVVVTLGLAVGP